MKYPIPFPTVKAVFALFAGLFIFSASAFAKKIYPVKGIDNTIYIVGPNYNYAPGDTFVLRASNNPYAYLEMISVNGTPSAPIVIMNEGGQVNIGFIRLRHCKYIKVKGDGSPSHTYGFFMTSPSASQPGISISGRTSNVEVHNIDINVMGYGCWIKEEAACEDSLQAPNWVIDNISVHDLRMTNIIQEGFYAGSTAPNGERSIVCNGMTIYPLTLRLSNIKIYNNIIDHTGRGGIQLASAPYGNNEIYNNTINWCGTELNGYQGNGIVLGGYTSAYVHDNTINNTLASGIFSLGAGLIRIENNTVNNSGSLNGVTVPYSSSIQFDTRLTNPLTPVQFIIKNNTLGNHTGGYHIRIYKGYYPYTTNNILCNNITTTGGPVNSYVETGLVYTGCATNQQPVVNAGNDQTITLPANSATLSGSATDPDGTIASYSWTKLSGPSAVNFTASASASTQVSGMVEGIYTFRLTATDNAGTAVSDDVTVTVNAPNIPPPSSTSLKIEAESYSNMSGIGTETTADVGGGLNVGWQDNNDWMNYSVNLSTAGTYTVNFRVASYFTGAQFQLKKADGTLLSTVTVPNTGSFQSWQTVSAQVTLPAGQQSLRIVTSAANGGWNINWWEIQGANNSPSTNQAPIANAGADQTLTLPTNSVTVSGSGTDTDGSITSYAWTKISGPAAGTIAAAGAASTQITGLAEGTYTFRLTVTDNNSATATDDVVVIVSSSTTSTSVKIEAESYTNMSGVGAENTFDIGGGLNIGWQDDNDWMDYSVNLSAAGTYTVNFRVASYFNGAQFQLRRADGTVLTTMNCPNTGSFQNWQTISAQVILPAGQQTLRIHTSAANGGWNINWWEIQGGSANPQPTPPPPVSTKIEAESFIAMNGIGTENTSDEGGGSNVGWQDNADWMDYSVNVGSTGTYTVNFRVASYFTGAQFQLRKADGSVLATLTCPNTGSFQTWTTISTSVELTAGPQTLRIYTTNANGGWNINWWEMIPSSVGTQSRGAVETVTETNPAASIAIYPNPVPDRFMLKLNNQLTGKMKIEIVDMKGSVVKQFSVNKSAAGVSQSYLFIGDLQKGQYILKISMNNYSASKQLIKQ